MPRVAGVTAAMVILLMMLTAAQSAKQAAAPASAKTASSAQAVVIARHASKHRLESAGPRQPHAGAAGSADDGAEALREDREQPQSLASMRFRQFINPRPLASNSSEAMLPPNAKSAQFAAEPVFAPSSAPPAATQPQGAGPALADEPAAPDAMSENRDGGGRERQATVQRAREGEAISAAKGNPDNHSSLWIQLAFLAWGGVLTIGAAIRMLIG